MYIFFLLLVQAPRSTLFPYTTLFRSALSRYGKRTHLQARRVVSRSGAAEQSAPVARVDRKSTRLNSSHTVSSYAVVCLKKKNEMKTALAPHAFLSVLS